jgi:glycosyltransferase involved in cell wall biosynthesis
MKIGLYGGMANNLYVLSQALVHAGHEVCFIRDRNDRYAFSQPVWEDCSFPLPYQKVIDSSSWSWEAWNRLEQSCQWRAPGWLADPLDQENPAPGHPESTAMEYLQACDLNIVCGVIPTLLAAKAGVPYIIFPHGGDIRTAAGFHGPKTFNPRKKYDHYMNLVRPLRDAYRRALFVGTHDPTGVGGHIGDVMKKLPGVNLRFFAIPFKKEPRICRAQRKEQIKNIFKNLDLSLPDADYYLFIPSRIDFFWKGQDRFFRAMRRVRNHPFHVIAAGWGTDFSTMKESFESEDITFLPCALSKPLMRSVFSASDLVVDQFIFGTYGTSVIEAMSCGAPVMMWLNSAEFEKRGFPLPPVINSHDEEDIRRALQDISDGSLDLEAQGDKMQAWVSEYFGYEHALPRFEQLIEEMLG